MAKHNELGKFGEEKAREYLISNGYAIRHCNWRSGKNELDIVAEKDNMLVVVEVKMRSSDFFGNPEDSITNAKMKRTISAAHDYICSQDINMETRFDIISILKNAEGHYEIEHIEDAFMPSWR